MKAASKEDVIITVIIPTHNRKEQLIRLISTIIMSDFRQYEIIVVDDASADGTYETLQEIVKSGVSLKILRNPRERFKSGSINAGVREAKGKILLIIDDDNTVSPTLMSKLMEVLSSDPRIGVVGPVTLISGTNTVLYGGARYNLFGICKFFYRGYSYSVIPKKPFSVDAIPNCFMTRREVFEELGGFDEIQFPIGDEDGEFMQRVRKKGLKVVVVPEAVCYHPYVIIRPNPIRIYYLIRSKIFLLRKHFPYKYQFFILILPAYLIYYIILALVMSCDCKSTVYFLKAILLAAFHGVFYKLD
jgi:GT2 family glycosyltransferase